MVTYLIICSLLIPFNLWAAITPHLHSDLSMRILHGVSTVVLIPLLISLWRQRQEEQLLPAMVLGAFIMVLIIVNSKITAYGMGVAFGWLDHLMLALASLSLVTYYLFAPSLNSTESS